MSKRIIYQTLPRLWGKGKFSDWDDASLDYLRSLGVDYVWYTGVPRHATGQDFVNYIIQLYVKEGIDELGPDKLPAIISMKYGSIPDGMKVLGSVDVARGLFLDFQKNLYLNNIAS